MGQTPGREEILSHELRDYHCAAGRAETLVSVQNRASRWEEGGLKTQEVSHVSWVSGLHRFLDVTDIFSDRRYVLSGGLGLLGTWETFIVSVKNDAVRCEGCSSCSRIFARGFPSSVFFQQRCGFKGAAVLGT